MTGIKGPHSRIFEQLLANHRQELIESLIAGTPTDHSAYRQIVGRIQGVSDALELSKEADFKLSGDVDDGA